MTPIARIIALIGAMILLAGCTGESCYDADDFGFANLTVSARYTKEELDNQQGENQVGPWRDSTYRVNGRPLVILVKHWEYELNKNRGSEVSAWCPWFGFDGEDDKLSDFCHRLQDCTFDSFMCTNTADARINNAPCIFRKGVGLYALISEKDVDPNASLTSMREPRGITFHLGEPQTEYEMLDIAKDGSVHKAGGRVYLYDTGPDSPDALKRFYADGPLYFKILDKFYDDNNGQYRISIKSGVSAVNPDPITFIINLVKDFIFGEGGEDYGLIQRLYQGVIDNDGYRFAVSALLTLYIIYTGLAYLTGNIELSQTELITRVCKIGLISALISTERSWSFFYDYLFVFFVGGVQQILDIIMEAGASGPGAPGILAMMIAPQTMAKLFSLLFVDWLGFIYILLFFFALYFVLKIFFDAAVIYLTALLTVGLIIALAPIFICFLLFSFTRSLFENWLRQLISYAVQPIILFTGLVFISFIIRDELYASLGFRVCKHFFPALSDEAGVFGELTEEELGVNIGQSPFYWWFPEPMKGENFSDTMVNIPIPIDHFDTSGDFCEAYGCFGMRYADLPFLDPNTTRGQSRINHFHNGKFVQLDGLLLIFVAIYLLHQFNSLTIAMARFITGTSGNLTDIEQVQRSAKYGSAHSLASLKGVAGKGFKRTRVGKAYLSGRKALQDFKEKAKQYPSQKFDEYAIRRLEKKAVTSKASASVLAEVEKRTGMRQSDIVTGAGSRYERALSKKMRVLDPSLTRKQSDKIAQNMQNKKFSELPEELAQAKYGKKFDQLSQKEQAQIKDILAQKRKGKSLRQLYMEAQKEKRFKKAYVDAHQAMSYRGIGVFGKSSGAIRSYDEFKHRMKQNKREKEQKKLMRGERIMSGIEGVKSGVYEGVTGDRGDKGYIGKKYFGGGYHDINKKDPALRTYDEVLREQRDSAAREKIERKIDAISKREGTSVVSPEFMVDHAHDKDIGGYKELARQGVANQVHRELRGDEEPVIKGQRYMENYAKDSELVEMIDRTIDTESRIFVKDQFISREEDYEYRVESAREKIEQDFKDYREAFGDEIEPEKMPEQLEQYLQERGEDKEEIREIVEELKESIEDYDYSQRVLQEIDERKQMVSEEINKEIENINEARVKSGMEEYYGSQEKESPSVEKSELPESSSSEVKSQSKQSAIKELPKPEEKYPVRRVRKIEDHLRNIR